MKKFAFLFAVLFCPAVFAQDLPKIAVRVTGVLAEEDLRALGAGILAAFDNDGRYKGIERQDAFLAEIDSAQGEQLYTVGDSVISGIGKRFGAKFVCLAEVSLYDPLSLSKYMSDIDEDEESSPMYKISAYIIDTETVKTVFKAEGAGPIYDMAVVSYRIVAHLLGRKAGETRPYTNMGYALKYQIPVSELGAGWGGVGIDLSWYFYKAWHMGFDVSAGWSSADRKNSSELYPDAKEYLKVFDIAAAYNFGYAYYFAKNAGLALGVSAGFGTTQRYRELEYEPAVYDEEEEEWEDALSLTKTEIALFEFAGPFVKLRWFFSDIGHSSTGIELSYRGMVGWKAAAEGDRGDTWETDRRSLGKKTFNYNYRIWVGLCVE